MAGWTSRYNSPDEAPGAFDVVPVPRSVVADAASRAAVSVLAEATLQATSGADVSDSLLRARQVADSVVRSRSPLRSSDGVRSRAGEREGAQGGVLYAPRVVPSPPAALLPRDLVRAVPQLATLRGVADGDTYSGGLAVGAGGGASSALQPGGVRPDGAPRRRGSRSPSPTRHRRPVTSRPASPAGGDTAEVGGSSRAFNAMRTTGPLPGASFPPVAGPVYNPRGAAAPPGGVSLGAGEEEEAQYPTLAGPPSASTPSSAGFSVGAAPPPAHQGNLQPLAHAPPPVQTIAPAAPPAAKLAPPPAVAVPPAPAPSRPALPSMTTASMLAPSADVGPQASPAAPVEEEISSPVAPPPGWAASRQEAQATSGGPFDDGGFTFSFSPPVQKVAVELPPLFKGFAHNEPAAGRGSIDAGWAAGMTPQAQRAHEALQKATVPPPAAPAPPHANAALPPHAPPPASHTAPVAAPVAPPPQPPPSPQQSLPPVSLPGGPAPVSPSPPPVASEQQWQQQQQWPRPPMVSRETQTVESELAASAPARRYIHGAEERVAPPGGPAAAKPAPPPRGGPNAAAFERVRPMDEEPDDGTWYDWWIRARLC
jgi:hypothetical protein